MFNSDEFFWRQRIEQDALANQNRLSEAIYVAEKSAYETLVNLGLLFAGKTNQLDKAAYYFRMALKIFPVDWISWCNLCHIYTKLYFYKSGLEAGLKSIKYSDGISHLPFYNTGVVCSLMGNHAHAIQMFESALKMKPDGSSAAYNLGLSYLATKNYQKGWDLYENRFLEGKLSKKCKERFKQPEWDGSDIHQKTLLIYSEQGLGDFIFFARFLPFIKNLVSKIKIEVQKPLVELIKQNFAVDEVIGRDDNLEGTVDSDYCISICSLPRLLKIYADDQIPNDPYIQSKKVNQTINKIGICWAGNPNHPKDCMRSIPIKHWKPLLENQNYEYFSLMVNSPTIRKWNGKEINLNEGIQQFKITNLTENTSDFRQLLECIEDLDLVITVDTGLAHLCGASGKKVWIVLPQENDWRWSLESDQTVWYPSAKLFRKKTSWDDLFSDVNSLISSDVQQY
jgi:tetratricopeptide (TPR) repeat protein